MLRKYLLDINKFIERMKKKNIYLNENELVKLIKESVNKVLKESDYFDTDDRYFSEYYAKYGVIPTDETLPYKASDDSANGKYVHPEKDKIKFKNEKGNNIKRTKKNY